MKLTELSNQIYTSAKSRGFYHQTQEKGTALMLIVRELAEALEADRRADFANLEAYERAVKEGDQDAYLNHISGTFEEEIADSFIQLLSFCGSLKIDIDFFMKMKIEFNQNRPFLHNKKY